MLVRIVTPAPVGSKSGNRVSALRWARMLRELGHRVILQHDYDGSPADVLFALHAKKSAAAVQRFAGACPSGSIVVALTGTDLYRDFPGDAEARATLERASVIVALQPLARERLPAALRANTRVVLQSAPVLRHKPPPRARSFDVCVLGHLRAVKDPLRAALAVRGLESSRLVVLQAGAALSTELAARARREMRDNPRYRWLGELPRHRARQLLARSRLMVLSSRMEGGANVVSEALAVKTPILASRIEGTVGQLGEDYPGYFEVGDTRGLRALLLRAENDARFLTALTRSCARVAARFTPAKERAALAALMRSLS